MTVPTLNRRFALIALALVLPLARAASQDVSQLLVEGDRLLATDAATALAMYQRAAALDTMRADAAAKTAGALIDLAEYDADGDRRAQRFREAEGYARRAARLAPENPNMLFALARALGRNALSQGPRDRVRYGKEVRELSLAALAKDPRHPGALHVLGMWHAEVMRLSSVTRFFARTLLGGEVLGTANWDEAQRDLEAAVAVEPNRAVHHLDLAKIYLDRRDSARAQAQLEALLTCPRMEFNDPQYRREAEGLLARLRGA
jgi:hypothetical protein